MYKFIRTTAFILVSLVAVQSLADESLILTNTLYIGIYDAITAGEVSKVQEFLRDQGDFTYPDITGYFGPITEAAVKQFQAREGIVFSGTRFTTGYGQVGPLTRARIAEVSAVVEDTLPDTPDSEVVPAEDPDAPTVDIRVNNQDGDLRVSAGDEVELAWTSGNVESCGSSGEGSVAWATTSRATSGTYNIFTLGQSGTSTFTITCASGSDEVSDTLDLGIIGEVGEHVDLGSKGVAGNDNPRILPTALPSSIRIKRQELFTFSATDRDGDGLRWEIDWADGSQTTIDSCPPAEKNHTIYAVHEWVSPGRYLLTASVFDCRTGDHTQSLFINVIG